MAGTRRRKVAKRKAGSGLASSSQHQLGPNDTALTQHGEHQGLSSAGNFELNSTTATESALRSLMMPTIGMDCEVPHSGMLPRLPLEIFREIFNSIALHDTYAARCDLANLQLTS